MLTARYVLPISGPHIEHGAVLVRGTRIAEVGTLDELRARHPGEEVRDFGQAALMPGFVDCHTHMEFTVFRGLVTDSPYTQWKMRLLALEERLDPADWEDSARLGALEAVRSGITTVADITPSGASARAAAEAGLRGVVYREVATMRKRDVPDVLARASEDIAAWNEIDSRGLLTIGIAPHSPYACHPELFGRVAEKATAEGLKVATHLAGSRDEYDFVKYGSSAIATDFEDKTSWTEAGWLPTGVSPVRYLLNWGFFDAPEILAVHCVQVDDDDIAILAQRGVSVAYCARCNARLAMGVAPLREFTRNRLILGLGTDSPASSPTMDFFDEMRFGLMLQRAVSGEPGFFTARTFMRLATVWGARALGLGEQVGTLEEGKEADIIAVDLSRSHQVPTEDPYAALVHTSHQDNVLMTMVAGKMLYDAGAWTTLDPAALLARAVPIRAKLRG